MLALAGLLSGCFHALTGPDHLAALLPSIFGKRWCVAALVGLVWGTGHGLASLILGLSGFFLKGALVSPALLNSINFLGDFLIGSTLIVIGGIGLGEALQSELSVESEDSVQNDESIDILGLPSNSVSFNFVDKIRQAYQTQFRDRYQPLQSSKALGVGSISLAVAIFVNGVVLGLSWDGMPSLSPALAANNVTDAVVFLFFYWVGTVLAMAFSCSLIACLSVFWTRMSSNYGSIDTYKNKENLEILYHKEEEVPCVLSLFSSLLAVGIGVYWLAQTLLRLLLLMAGKKVLYLADSTVPGGLIQAEPDDLEAHLDSRGTLYMILNFSVPFTAMLAVVAVLSRRLRLWNNRHVVSVCSSLSAFLNFKTNYQELKKTSSFAV